MRVLDLALVKRVQNHRLDTSFSCQIVDSVTGFYWVCQSDTMQENHSESKTVCCSKVYFQCFLSWLKKWLLFLYSFNFLRGKEEIIWIFLVMHSKLTVFHLDRKWFPFLERLPDLLMIPQMRILELYMMPIQFELTFWNDHDMLEVQIQNQLMKTEKWKRITTILDNQPEFILAEWNSLKESHFEKILKRVIVILPKGCYFLFQVPSAIFLSCDFKSM